MTKRKVEAGKNRAEHLKNKKEKNLEIQIQKEIESYKYYQTLLKDTSHSEKNHRITAKECANTLYFIDKKYTYNKNWNSHSFNKDRAVKLFFKQFIFKYYIPEIFIINATVSNIIEINTKLAKNYINSIINNSFKKDYPQFNTKERHFILSNKDIWTKGYTVEKLIWKARALARDASENLAVMISNIFCRFNENSLMINFCDFICHNKNYNWTKDELSDITDFIVTLPMTFSFAGRTVKSIIDFSNKWHEEQIKKSNKKITWPGLTINDYSYEDKDNIWEIKQLKTQKELVNEGRKMHHCVASYEKYCVEGKCGIFNVSRYDKNKDIVISEATVEVRNDNYINQMRGICNAEINSSTKQIIMQWKRINSLYI